MTAPTRKQPDIATALHWAGVCVHRMMAAASIKSSIELDGSVIVNCTASDDGVFLFI